MGKRFKKILEQNKFDQALSVHDGAALAISASTAKFDETIDICVNLNIDPKKGEQNVRGKLQLPKSLGKKVKVCVIANEDKQQEAKDAGADIVGGDDLVEKIEGGFFDFDRCISTPDMMPKVGKLGKVLGPRNLMPNPKLGSVTNEIGKAVSDAKAGEIEYKSNETLLQAGVAKSNFTKEEIVQNIQFFIATISKERPTGIKGDFIKKLSISPTMGPGINIDLSSVIK
jgi:large subunit ribosomal protein L1